MATAWATPLTIVLVLGLAAVVTCLSTPPEVLVEASSQGMRDFMGLHYRALHRIPELKFEEHLTSNKVQSALKELGIKFTAGLAGGTGIIATIGSGRAPVVALRADMDALPVVEPDDVLPSDMQSVHAGKMHACGHDAHMAMLLGAARMLQARAASLQGTVLLVFQPGEEGGAGARRMLASSEELRAAHVMFGMHNAPWVPQGVISSRPGTIMAASTSFHATITGAGGHAAYPHLLVDPVVAAAACITALQTLASREADPASDGVVVSVTQLHTPSGGAVNVMPDEVVIGGTIRALTPETFTRIQERVYAIIKAQAELHRCNASVHSGGRIPYPPVVNDLSLYNIGMEVATEMFQGDASKVTVADAPTMGAEDFSFFAQQKPCMFFFLGQANATTGTDVTLHSRRYKFNEEVLPLGAALHTAVALHVMSNPPDLWPPRHRFESTRDEL